MASPAVSVIVPAYNAEATLAKSLSSALASTYGGFELLVIDDGSSDRTARIAEGFASADRRVKVHRRNQGGVSAALNHGLRNATGDFVARLDSDDVWHPTKLEKQIAVMTADPEVALVYTFVRYVDWAGKVVRDVAPQRFPRRPLARMLHSGLVGGNSSVMMRRSALVEAGGFDETLASWEDLLVHIAVSARHPIAFVPEYLVGYRVRPGSLSADRQNMLDSWRVARQKIERQFPQVPRHVHRWGHSRRTLELAEGFAWQGHHSKSARLLAEALIADPERTLAFLSYRLKRKLGGKVRVDCGEAPLFSKCDVARQYRLSAFDRGLEGARLRALDSRRERMMDEIDRRLAAD